MATTLVSNGSNTCFIQTLTEKDNDHGSVCAGSLFPERTTSPWLPYAALAQTPQHTLLTHVLLLPEHSRPWLPQCHSRVRCLPALLPPWRPHCPPASGGCLCTRGPESPPCLQAQKVTQLPRESPGYFPCSWCPPTVLSPNLPLELACAPSAQALKSPGCCTLWRGRQVGQVLTLVPPA